MLQWRLNEIEIPARQRRGRRRHARADRRLPVGPNYVRPPAPSTPAFKELGDWKPAQPNDAVSRGKWWEIFGDPKLNALADQVDLSNQNVQFAEARLRQAEALVEQSRSGLWPTLALSASATRSRAPNIAGSTDQHLERGQCRITCR